MSSAEKDVADEINEAVTPERRRELRELIAAIGVARFSSRIGAGLIGAIEGNQAIEEFVKADEERPLISKLGQALLRRPNSYEKG